MDPRNFRLSRLVRKGSGQSLIVAFDRGLGCDASDGGSDPALVARNAVAGGADGLLVSPGLTSAVRSELAFRGAPALLVRLDFMLYGALQPPGTADLATEEYRVVATPTEAAELGADAVVMFLVLGNRDDSVTADNVRAVAEAATEARRIGLPLIVETVLWGSRIEDQSDLDSLIYLNRLAAELGADAVKTQHPGDAESMRKIVKHCPVPLFALGGPRVDSDSELVDVSRSALQGGAIGLVYGRNIWQAQDPISTTLALSNLVDEELS